MSGHAHTQRFAHKTSFAPAAPRPRMLQLQRPTIATDQVLHPPRITAAGTSWPISEPLADACISPSPRLLPHARQDNKDHTPGYIRPTRTTAQSSRPIARAPDSSWQSPPPTTLPLASSCPLPPSASGISSSRDVPFLHATIVSLLSRPPRTTQRR